MLVRSRVAWGAVFAGALVAISCFLSLGALWAAVELSTGVSETPSASLFVSGLALVALFAGGLVTTRLSAGESRMEAGLYGVLMWGVTAVFLLYLAVNGILVLGSSMILGEGSGGELAGLSRSDAWLAFAGVAASLVAAILGTLAGFPTLHATRAKAAAAPRERPQPA